LEGDVRKPDKIGVGRNTRGKRTLLSENVINSFMSGEGESAKGPKLQRGWLNLEMGGRRRTI